MMLRNLALLLATAILTVGCATTDSGDQEAAPTLFLVGDSTMADQPDEKYPETGWGQALPDLVNDGIVVENHAKNGRSTKSFIEEGRWDAVLKQLQPGDVVVMGFGHNDQKEYDDTRYAAPWTDYRHNLERMVDEARARGASPILVTSIYRRAFHDSGQPRSTLGDYPEVTRAVASERGVPLVDLNVLTRQMLLDAGPEASADIYMQVAPGEYANLPEGKDDNTHLQRRGARRVAGLFVADIKRQELPLARYFR
ncbi:rhamnogalacturonan acetylesterase [Marinimicrobium sp. ARAG 43.8]|uniref:rhamnogalacturonan acetylesterase n=1 Tax=Marinimicrobium sp. ARAG 43.8 TaxID=3418719 RepID=UPI003CF870A6